MKLREVITAISGFKYIIDEYDIFPNGQIKKSRKEVRIDETGMRCLQHDLRHEKLVKGGWICLGKDEFQYLLHSVEPETKINKVVVRRNGQTIKKFSRGENFMKMVGITDHFIERTNERFTNHKDVRKFILSVLDGEHFVVQGAEFYNTSREHKPTHAYVCSLRLGALVAVSFEEGRYVFITCFPVIESKWFANWFQDNMYRVHELPNIEQYFNFKKKAACEVGTRSSP